jgi:hypothetical protein
MSVTKHLSYEERVQMSYLRQSDSSVGVISHGDYGSLRSIEVNNFPGIEEKRGSSWGGLAEHRSSEDSGSTPSRQSVGSNSGASGVCETQTHESVQKVYVLYPARTFVFRMQTHLILRPNNSLRRF